MYDSHSVPKRVWKSASQAYGPALGAQWQIMQVEIEYNLISGFVN